MEDKMEDCGNIETIQIDSDDFRSLFFELSSDESGFIHNRSNVLEDYKH